MNKINDSTAPHKRTIRISVLNSDAEYKMTDRTTYYQVEDVPRPKESRHVNPHGEMVIPKSCA